MNKEELSQALLRAKAMMADGNEAEAKALLDELIVNGFEKKISELGSVIKMMGFDVHRAPDHMSFTILPNEMADLMHPVILGEDMKNAMRFRVEVDMLAPARQAGNEIASKVCSVLLLKIMESIGKGLVSAAEAHKAIKEIKKGE